MSNRILKESICTSDTIERLNPFQETMFYRLIVNCDDYGRMDARPAILKAKLFPLKERLTLRDIEDALQALADAGCVELYAVDKRPYLCLPSWKVHQQIRAKKSKFPSAENADTPSEKPGCLQSEIPCNQLISNDCECPRNPIQSESNLLRGANAPRPPAEPEITLPLNDGSEYPVFAEQVQEWAGLYPNADIRQELRKMRGWLLANKQKRKTARGIQRFINSWLSREQDKGGVTAAQKPGIKPLEEW